MDDPTSSLRSRMIALTERMRTSLFVVPMLFVLSAVVLAQVTLAIDRADTTGRIDLPLGFSTVDGARAVLTTVGAATIGFAGVAFSVSLLVVQMASSQYSPRVVSGLLRNPFAKRVMGTVVGTFTYCLVVLRAVRSSNDDSGEDVVASLSVTLGVLLGIVAILATIAFINHSAHSMDVSELLQSITDDAVEVVRSEWPEPENGSSRPTGATTGDTTGDIPDDAHPIRFTASGWIQRVDFERLALVLPAGTTLHLEVTTGRYAVLGTPLGALHPAPADDNDLEEVEANIRDSIHVGAARTSRQDVGYGIRQLTDVALRALSPSVNDPTTAQDAVFHMCVILHELLQRRPPTSVTEHADDRRLVRHHVYSHRELVDLAFEQIRRVAAGEPSVCVYLLEAIHLLCESLDGATDDAIAALHDQAALVLAGCESSSNIQHDVDLVRTAYRHRFGA